MKANGHTSSRSADSKHNLGKNINPSDPISDVFFKTDNEDRPTIGANRDAEVGVKSFNSAILGFGVKPIHVSDKFEDKDIPEENLF